MGAVCRCNRNGDGAFESDVDGAVLATADASNHEPAASTAVQQQNVAETTEGEEVQVTDEPQGEVSQIVSKPIVDDAIPDIVQSKAIDGEASPAAASTDLECVPKSVDGEKGAVGDCPKHEDSIIADVPGATNGEHAPVEPIEKDVAHPQHAEQKPVAGASTTSTHVEGGEQHGEVAAPKKASTKKKAVAAKAKATAKVHKEDEEVVAKGKDDSKAKPKKAKFSTADEANGFLEYAMGVLEQPANKKLLLDKIKALKSKAKDDLEFQLEAMNVLPPAIWKLIGSEMEKYGYHEGNMMVGLLHINKFAEQDKRIKKRLNKLKQYLEGDVG